MSHDDPVAHKATAWLVGTGTALPAHEVMNADLPASLGIDPAGIEKKTGIQKRRWAAEGIYTSDLGAQAAQDAITTAAIPPEDVDCLIAATQSPDHAIPGIGVVIQAKLGLTDIPCYDLRNQCSNFLYALQMADAFIRAGTYRRVLIVCAEIQSHALGMTPADAAITPLFGDGAAAAVIAERPMGAYALAVRWCRIGADGRGADKLRHRVWDVSRIPPWDVSGLDEPERCIRYAEMNGESVFRAAVKGMTEGVRQCLLEQGLDIEQIDRFIPHQANASINKTVASILGIKRDRVCSNIADVGNVAGASLPILLAQSLFERAAQPGERMLLTAFGAGFTWGTAMLEAHVC